MLYLVLVFFGRLFFDQTISLTQVSKCSNYLFFRIVSLDLRTNMSTEVEILCKETDCSLLGPNRMTLVKDQMYILHNTLKVSLLEGKPNSTFIIHFSNKSAPIYC